MSNLDIDPVSLAYLRVIVAVELALGERDPKTLLYLKSGSLDSENTLHTDSLALENCVSDGCGLVSPLSDPLAATRQQTCEKPLPRGGAS
jgi:hypothetical protein